MLNPCCAGNILSILSTERIGISVAYPIFQCGLFVAGLLGIGLFNEIERQVFFHSLLSRHAMRPMCDCCAHLKHTPSST